MKVQPETIFPLELVPLRWSVAVALWSFTILNSVFVPAAAAQTGPTAQEMNNSNNPLTPALGLNLQDQYAASYYGLNNTGSNAVLARGVVPLKLFGLPQIVRATVPIVTSADQPLGSRTGLGDINVFDVLLFKVGPINLGVGPQLTLPSATNDRLGTGRWQAGPAGVLIAPEPWGLLGGLVTYQHSFAGGNGRPVQNNLQAQPFVIYNLPQGFYLRSTATWNFDLERGNYYIPIGLGAGKIWNLPDGTTINLFAEPQYTVAHYQAAPQWQFFMGLNLQFPLKR